MESYTGINFEKTSLGRILNSDLHHDLHNHEPIRNRLNSSLFNPFVKDTVKQKIKSNYDFSWNWPYDYFSLVELVSIDVRHTIESEDSPEMHAGGLAFGNQKDSRSGLSENFMETVLDIVLLQGGGQD